MLDKDIKKLFKNCKKPIIITPGEELLGKDKISLLSAITHYKNKYSLAVLIFFETTQIQLEDLNPSVGHKLLQNTSYISLLNFENTNHFCKHIAMRWNIDLSDKQIKHIYDYSGGQMSLIKETLRDLSKKEELLSNIFSSNEMKYKQEKIWQGLPQTHREYLSKLINKNSNPELNNKIHRDLTNLGFVSATQKIPNFIQQLAQAVQIKITIKDSNIFFNEVNLSSFFNKKEQRILEAFYYAVDNKVKRNNLAEVIWEDNKPGDYSDWALDKTISRFRSKLNALGIPSSALITLREQGYQLLLSNK